MGSRDRRHWIVFGAGDKPNKSLIAYPSKMVGGCYAVKICELSTDCDYDYGFMDKPTTEKLLEEISGEYTTLYFTKKESVDAFIKLLEHVKEQMEHES